MFRNPRENLSIEKPVKPSVGRAPTPPNESRPPQPPSTMASRSAKPLTPRPNSKSNLPVLGKAQTANKKIAPVKTPGKPNASILSFFKKVDSPMTDDPIFLSQGSRAAATLPTPKASTPEVLDSEDDDIYGVGYTDTDRFNEVEGSVKRRKTSGTGTPNAPGIDTKEDCPMQNDPLKASAEAQNGCTPPPPEITGKPKPKKQRRTGPFLSDSESDYEVDNPALQTAAVQIEKRQLRSAVAEQSKDTNEVVTTKPVDQEDIQENRPIVPEIESVGPADQLAWKRRKRVPVAEAQAKWEALQPKDPSPKDESSGAFPVSPKLESVEKYDEMPSVPSLKKEATIIDEWGGFEDLEEFPDDDEFGEGEEAVERKWMEEQARLEAAELGEDDESFNGFDDEPMTETLISELPEESMTAACPICEAALAGISPEEATRHVNGCLDGNPVPLPTPVKSEPAEIKYMPPEAKNRFARKAAIARPGQANPIALGGASSDAPSSAFSKLMSGKAEDSAWANAAAAEAKSRGKPAYQRTCPFYKIMPGFFICVDAFRYGAVQGCNAYFLSHFHSDHYIGLTSSWCHGPIYCSKVTANLVKQQLKVDPKYVVPLQFEERFEVPGTQGVAVTMIPANHCPGSSLFLFEKVVGKGANPKIQRVLHCGDFRACPAHIAHPLLMPDIVDSITGKTKQQKIDVCYLDTTYLNPRYAFPSQEEVIKACADMCVSLRKERAEESDAWEQVKKERAGSGMTKFVNSAIKAEDDSIAMSLSTKSNKSRGRLLVICGTYSIGKERICLGIARALDCKIWAPPGKIRICAALEDEELTSRMTDDPREAQIHMQMLMEIRPETLQDYLNSYKPHFSRIVGFRPSGWNYKPPNSRFTDSPSVSTVLYSQNWKSSYSMSELVPQRGSTREASCFGVPYSEHSSFRELTMFICALRIEKVVPTVNVGTATGRSKMKAWIERWLAERRKNGCLRLGQGEGEVRW
ncbi:DRMBL-domain-containing protein [Mollisia scopiformis]|uniref:DRMBL-domain-containing protein n=1 Tax=Mollisia scopiformis TaxID=149040 RepID=A0A194WU05_MOLSC|nr:DRMBL-domain-containing protein [Mollisia scopiformis]KUJ11092.1 DRMBL-domain-containing protein [Mollisia scopiformis]